MSNPLFQPAMNTYFNSADEFLEEQLKNIRIGCINNLITGLQAL